ncbi:sensor histidine kinase [bacterium]|nr:sensor histidine kinase [bacterium]
MKKIFIVLSLLISIIIFAETQLPLSKAAIDLQDEVPLCALSIPRADSGISDIFISMRSKKLFRVSYTGQILEKHELPEIIMAMEYDPAEKLLYGLSKSTLYLLYKDGRVKTKIRIPIDYNKEVLIAKLRISPGYVFATYKDQLFIYSESDKKIYKYTIGADLISLFYSEKLKKLFFSTRSNLYLWQADSDTRKLTDFLETNIDTKIKALFSDKRIKEYYWDSIEDNIQIFSEEKLLFIHQLTGSQEYEVLEIDADDQKCDILFSGKGMVNSFRIREKDIVLGIGNDIDENGNASMKNGKVLYLSYEGNLIKEIPLSQPVHRIDTFNGFIISRVAGFGIYTFSDTYYQVVYSNNYMHSFHIMFKSDLNGDGDEDLFMTGYNMIRGGSTLAMIYINESAKISLQIDKEKDEIALSCKKKEYSKAKDAVLRKIRLMRLMGEDAREEYGHINKINAMIKRELALNFMIKAFLILLAFCIIAFILRKHLVILILYLRYFLSWVFYKMLFHVAKDKASLEEDFLERADREFIHELPKKTITLRLLITRLEEEKLPLKMFIGNLKEIGDLIIRFGPGIECIFKINNLDYSGKLLLNSYTQFLKIISSRGYKNMEEAVILIKTVEDLVGQTIKKKYFELLHSLEDVLFSAFRDIKNELTARDYELDLEKHITSDGFSKEPIYYESSFNFLRRFIFNLLRNATDAVISDDKSRSRIQLTGEPADKSYIIVVEDNGIGIPDDRINLISRIGYSTKGELGMGLGITKSKLLKLKTKFSCDFSIESKPGKGTRVILKFKQEIL